MTDFLDQLEDELRVAAERRGRPRRRRAAGALKALAALAAVALIVAGGARLAGDNDAEQSAAPSPTPAMPDLAYATTGRPALLDLLSARQRGFMWTEIPDDPPSTADPSLGTAVLYRPAGEETARFIAFGEKIDEVRPLTPADEERIHFDVSGANVVVVYGREREERMLRDPRICAPAGGSLKLCVDRSDEQRYSVFVQADEPMAVEPLDDRGWWSWAAAGGDTILASWTGFDCEGSRAALIVGGRPQPLTDEPSEALGWTTDGRAIVSVGACGGGEQSTYLVSPDGSREPFAGPKPERSVQPRSVEG